MEQPQLTLFLWVRGMFPRRIVYQLLIKGLVASPADMLAGKSSVDSLTLKISTLTVRGLIDDDPTDPKPTGNSSPCLRIVDMITGTERWIHESSAIATYIEDAFPHLPPLQSNNIVDRAITSDLVGMINLIGHDSSYYVRHAAAVASTWSGLANENRSLAAASNARQQMVKSFVKIQSWAGHSLCTTGWLTPGINQPGLADTSLAALLRYLELVYELDLLEDEQFGSLQGWWRKFKTLPWWNALEERGDVHPPEFAYGRKALEV